MPANYEDFRLQITPDLANPGQVSLQVLESPLAGLAGPRGHAAAVFAAADLDLLRDPNKWRDPNVGELRRIGAAAFAAVTNPMVEAAIQAGAQAATARGNKMRLIFSLIPAEGEHPAPVRISELPVEIIYTPGTNFYAPQLDTPISRALQTKPDRPTVPLTPPLRILAVVSSPVGLPPADVVAEQNAIRNALAASIQSGAVALDFCDPPTHGELVRRLLHPYHVVHFVGHGGVGRIGGDPTPRAFLCLEDDTRGLDPLDGDTLDLHLRNCPTANIVMITGCSTARLPPAVRGNPFAATAFDGIAQRLLGASNASKVSAVVAMQFDLDADAAVAFSDAFYSNLVRPDVTLDEAVTHARNAVVAATSIGCPAWANPVLYWRCQNGRPFDVQPFVAQPISPDVRDKLTMINIQIDAIRNVLDEIAGEPEAIRNAAAGFKASQEQKIDALYAESSKLLGNAIRLRGGSSAVGQTMRFNLTLRLRSPTVVRRVKMKIEFDATAFDFVTAGTGAHAAEQPLVASSSGSVTLAVDDVSGGAAMPEGEYEIATLDLRVKSASPNSQAVRISTLHVTTEPQTQFRALDGLAFLSAA